MSKYQDWIDINYPTPESAKDQCRNAATKLVETYPELEFQCGFIFGVMHCWAKNEHDMIIDPTAHQFNRHIKYEDYKFVANYLLRKDQVEEHNCIAFLDDGRVIVGI